MVGAIPLRLNEYRLAACSTECEVMNVHRRTEPARRQAISVLTREPLDDPGMGLERLDRATLADPSSHHER